MYPRNITHRIQTTAEIICAITVCQCSSWTDKNTGQRSKTNASNRSEQSSNAKGESYRTERPRRLTPPTAATSWRSQHLCFSRAVWFVRFLFYQLPCCLLLSCILVALATCTLSECYYWLVPCLNSEVLKRLFLNGVHLMNHTRISSFQPLGKKCGILILSWVTESSVVCANFNYQKNPINKKQKRKKNTLVSTWSETLFPFETKSGMLSS
jgi:hypothetical protein